MSKLTTAIAAIMAIFVLPAWGDTATELPQVFGVPGRDNVPTSTPIDADSVARGGMSAIHSVFRIICIRTNSLGSGFLHKSGSIITAAHVVKDCPSPLLLTADGLKTIQASVKASDEDIDLAVLTPATDLREPPLYISQKADLQIGTQVTTWGFPGGYTGIPPMLSVGYISGQDARRHDSGRIVTQWVVNAAFNSGNSGGPLLDAASGEVIGVVSSKPAPISKQSEDIMKALASNQSGFMYTETFPDGTTKSVSEGQIVGMVLSDLRKQIQLVIGYAVLTNDLRSFLTSNKIDP